ncbi:Cleft lip and palate transmembrane protein 1 [Smittium culicis]|uniref:Cleft lip and palate transmembrane protein 1 n=1 Tax=Smittium culicis TaxID=133412 RepID=A0A1R1X0L7_9FUNG|nr:Cleft lip and palate transmembrane protein 1 [Smittium culicis]
MGESHESASVPHSSPNATQPQNSSNSNSGALAADGQGMPDDPPFNYKDAIFNVILFAVASQVVSFAVTTYFGGGVPPPTNFNDNMDQDGKSYGVNSNDLNDLPLSEADRKDLRFNSIVSSWKKDTAIDAFFYINSKENITLELLSDSTSVTPVWSQFDINFGHAFSFDKKIDIDISQGVHKNESVYGHLMVKKKNSNTILGSPDFNINDYAIRTELISKHIVYKKKANLKNLLGKDVEDEAVQDDTDLVDGQQYTYFHPNLTIALVDPVDNVINYNSEPIQTKKWITPLQDQTEFFKINEAYGYLPIIYYNNFWQLNEHLYKPNKTQETISFNFNFSSMSMMKFYIYCSFDSSFNEAANASSDSGIGFSNGIDLFKRTLLETSPYLLAITFFVSLLHSLFDFLAFKNDVQFWNKKKDAVGVSIRTMILELSFEIIIFLYLFENNQDTSKVIILSSLVGLFISIWKIYKASDLKIEIKPTITLPTPKIDDKLDQKDVSNTIDSKENSSANKKLSLAEKYKSLLPGRKVIIEMNYKVITIRDTGSFSELESDTAKYDKIAFQYLSYAAYPLLGGYAIYSLYTSKFKSWYSYILSALVGYVYTFGFISMTPQLYINYKLKSVAHMPVKAFIYKALNTFVDDLFAFVMPMPTLHRIATLRDDVIFFIYLYQRYIYRVDPSRVNEFGQVLEEPTEDSKKNN